MLHVYVHMLHYIVDSILCQGYVVFPMVWASWDCVGPSCGAGPVGTVWGPAVGAMGQEEQGEEEEEEK